MLSFHRIGILYSIDCYNHIHSLSISTFIVFTVSVSQKYTGNYHTRDNYMTQELIKKLYTMFLKELMIDNLIK
jgi:hypothetical protein